MVGTGTAASCIRDHRVTHTATAEAPISNTECRMPWEVGRRCITEGPGGGRYCHVVWAVLCLTVSAGHHLDGSAPSARASPPLVSTSFFNWTVLLAVCVGHWLGLPSCMVRVAAWHPLLVYGNVLPANHGCAPGTPPLSPGDPWPLGQGWDFLTLLVALLPPFPILLKLYLWCGRLPYVAGGCARLFCAQEDLWPALALLPGAATCCAVWREKSFREKISTETDEALFGE